MKKIMLYRLLGGLFIASYCLSSFSQEFNYPTAVQNILAFPSAEGFGKFATGGRGGRVVTVTTLEDDTVKNATPGCLRWAVSQYPNEPITIVFDVSGHIRLKKILSIRRTAGVTIAGQTAPGEGICISGHKVLLGFSQNLILRDLRFRCGIGTDETGTAVGDQALGAENIANMIVDHCSLGWSGEEMSTTSDSHFITFQYCIIHEGLFRAGHHKGDRGYGICFGGSQATMHHCLLAHNNARTPRFSGAQSTDYVAYVEYVNNVNYNYINAAHGGEINVSNFKYHQSEANFVGNYYKPGPATLYFKPEEKKWIFFNQTVDEPAEGKHVDTPKWYFAGNVMEGSERLTKDNWKGITTDETTLYTVQDLKVDTFIQPVNFFHNYKFDWKAYTMHDRIESAEDAFQTVLAKAGCAPRDSIERRIIRETKDGTATFGGVKGEKLGIIDDPSDVEGGVGYIDYPTYEPRGVNYDTDGDGMPDEWEKSKGLNPNNPEDRNYITPEGYTALEVYLCSLMGETIEGILADPTSVEEFHSVKFEYEIAGDVLVLKGEKSLTGLHIFDMQGRCCMEEEFSGTSHSINISRLLPGTYILWVIDSEGYRKAVKFQK